MFPIDLFHSKNTPFYAYDLELLRSTLKTCLTEANKYNFHVHYALKANSNTRILDLISGLGFGADCVSGNEVDAAIRHNFPSNKVAFAGVGKADWEIEKALQHDIFAFNVESVEELQVIDELAKKHKKRAGIALRLNPNVNPYTHAYITTGLDENKFGIDLSELQQVLDIIKASECLQLDGIHFHIGSQITKMEAFKNLCIRVNELNRWFFEHGVHLKYVNVGGGLGVDYDNPTSNPIPNFKEYFSIFNTFLELLPNQEVHFELGRSLVAQCGSLISKVLFLKERTKKSFLILDAGLTELLRPALYQAFHKIDAVEPGNKVSKIYDVVGPICESSDCFGKAIDLPESKRGDLIAIRSAGAYGEVMANRYNLREQNEALFY